MWRALQHGITAMVWLLLNHCTLVAVHSGSLSLKQVIERGEQLMRIIENKALDKRACVVNKLCEPLSTADMILLLNRWYGNGNTIVLQAALTGDNATIQALFKHAHRLNIPNDILYGLFLRRTSLEGDTVLTLAVKNNDISVIETFIEQAHAVCPQVTKFQSLLMHTNNERKALLWLAASRKDAQAFPVLRCIGHALYSSGLTREIKRIFLHQATYDEDNVLMCAMRCNNPLGADYLFTLAQENGLTPRQIVMLLMISDRYTNTVLSYAAMYGATALINRILLFAHNHATACEQLQLVCPYSQQTPLGNALVGGHTASMEAIMAGAYRASVPVKSLKQLLRKVIIENNSFIRACAKGYSKCIPLVFTTLKCAEFSLAEIGTMLMHEDSFYNTNVLTAAAQEHHYEIPFIILREARSLGIPLDTLQKIVATSQVSRQGSALASLKESLESLLAQWRAEDAEEEDIMVKPAVS